MRGKTRRLSQAFNKEGAETRNGRPKLISLAWPRYSPTW